MLEAGNQMPVLAAISNQVGTEGELLIIPVSATDPDGTTPAFNTSALPTGATFTDNGDGTGDFNWTPAFDQGGGYPLTFRATDGVATDTEAITITINEAGNQPPVLATIGPRGTTEGINLNFSVSATDADATVPSLSAVSLPLGATFIDNANGTGTFDWTPDFTQAGVYDVTFIASDGSADDSEVVTITVVDPGNQEPLLAAIGAQSTTEGLNLNFGVSGSDPDGTTPFLNTSALPANATFVDNGDGTGTFDWTPDFTQSGAYSITFYASDGVAADSELVDFTVNEAGNQDPILATIGPQSTTEGINLNIPVSATDPDGAIPVLSANSLPVGASFVDNGDGTGTFDWNPGIYAGRQLFCVLPCYGCQFGSRQ